MIAPKEPVAEPVSDLPAALLAAPRMPAAGPHARPDLINEWATPGAGMLSDFSLDGEADPAGG
ncbi:hypothetical protein [Pseudoxanthobacter sp.]|uniref:hypothetical protein n=1 Tax=Pseudoxanthobacter sp. TaxID=1925742 RepID=UPI002FE08713